MLTEQRNYSKVTILPLGYLKGGDPATPSSMATLLRLNTHRWIYLSPDEHRDFGYPQLC